ncbi:MAG: nucleotidyltransferase domain-containing protein [Gemmatimonadota bacterium]
MAVDQEMISQLQRAIAACGRDRVRRIILYGSMVTGEAGADSDLDLLVVERGPVSGREERMRYQAALRGFPRPVDVWVMGEEEFEETKDVVGGLAYPAHKYGIALR